MMAVLEMSFSGAVFSVAWGLKSGSPMGVGVGSGVGVGVGAAVGAAVGAGFASSLLAFTPQYTTNARAAASNTRIIACITVLTVLFVFSSMSLSTLYVYSVK